MIDQNRDRSLDELASDTSITLAALKRAQDSAIRLHRAFNTSMAGYKDGEVVEVSPFDLQTEEERTLQK